VGAEKSREGILKSSSALRAEEREVPGGSGHAEWPSASQGLFKCCIFSSSS
jgi:hypothetical protein